jgi:hypothetical protein
MMTLGAGAGMASTAAGKAGCCSWQQFNSIVTELRAAVTHDVLGSFFHGEDALSGTVH